MEQTTTPETAPVAPVAQPVKKKSNTLVIILAVIFGIIALCGIVVVIGFAKVKDLINNADFVNEVKQQVEQQQNFENNNYGEETPTQSGSSNNTTSDTCAYLSKETLSSLIGKNITTQTNDGDKKTCTYTTDPSNYTDAVIMIVSVEQPSVGQTAATYIEIVKSTVLATEIEKINVKSADVAYWGGAAKMLIASKGNKILLIATQTISQTDNSKEYTQKAADYLMPKL